MIKNTKLFTKGFAGLLSLSLVTATLPVQFVSAEDYDSLESYEYNEYDEEFAEYSDEEAFDEVSYDAEEEEVDDVDLIATEATDESTFVITRFVDFEKDEDGKFVNEDTRKKYGKLTAAEGTALEDLGLPEELTLEGHWDYDSSDELWSIILEDMVWKLDSETEVYSEDTPAGEYKFVPDFETYSVMYSDFAYDYKLEEGLKNLKIKVTITKAEETEETEDVEGIDDSDTIDMEEFDEELSSDMILNEEKEEPSEDGETISENIFDNLDDSVLNTDSEEEYIEIIEANDSDSDTASENTITNEDELIAEKEAQEVQESSLQPLAPEASDTPEETEETEEKELSTTVTGVFGITDGNVAYSDPKEYTLSIYEDPNVIALSGLPCNMDMTNITVSFNGILFGTALDFSSGEALDLNYLDEDKVLYSVRLSLSKNAHAWSEATCMEPSTCANCYAQKGELADHTPSGQATCTSNDICAVCGEEIPDTMTGHDWKAATCTKPKTCKNCGAKEGKALGHKSNNDATCTENASCSVCGKEISDSALGHDWSPATCTSPKTCKRCNLTDGKALGHSFGEWTTTSKSTYTTHGEQTRYCQRDNCSETETKVLNIIADPSDNAINGITPGADFAVKTRFEFSASGAGTENTSPIDGDVRYTPSTWDVQGTPGTFLDGYSGAFSISKAGTYTLTVTYQKEIYNNGAWSGTSVADSKSITFTVGGGSSEGQESAIRINPQTGDDTPIIPIACACVAALAAIIGLVIYKKRR